MDIIVDTSVWSLVLRRRMVQEDNPWVATFRECVGAGDYLHVLGPVLQELLNGVREEKEFDRIDHAMSPFPMVPLTRAIYVEAARLENACRKRGILAGSVDFLIAAACIGVGYPLLTADADFARIAAASDLILVQPRA